MKVKNVIRGHKSRISIEELSILSSDKVIYSGTLDGWEKVDPDMMRYKKEIESMEVEKSMTFNNRKLFVFV